MTEANWYADPQDPNRLRYWDGSAWTDHTSERPSAPTSAFDAAALGVPWNADVSSSDIKIKVDTTSDSWWRIAGTGAAATLRSLLGGLIAAGLVGAVWFGINRFIADAGYMVYGLISTVPAMVLAAIIGFFASDRRERPGWAASMFATVLAALTFSIATNGALAGYFTGPGGLLISCTIGSTYAGVLAYAGRARDVSRWLVFLNVITCLFVALFVLAIVFGTDFNPIGDPADSPYEDCVLLDEFAASLDGESARATERAWNDFYGYVQDEMDGRRTHELTGLMAVQVLTLAANPDDEATRQRLDGLIDRYESTHDC